MKKKLYKFDNPNRVAELNPEVTLLTLGVNENSHIFDYGAGTGVFSIPAAKLGSQVFAYDINDDMLEIIQSKADEQSVSNITLLNPSDLSNKIDDIWADFVLLVTVYHEIDDKNLLFEHFANLLKDGGKIAVVEFHPKDSPTGPPLSKRVSKDDLKDDFSLRGYAACDEIDLGDNFYLVSFIR